MTVRVLLNTDFHRRTHIRYIGSHLSRKSTSGDQTKSSTQTSE